MKRREPEEQFIGQEDGSWWKPAEWTANLPADIEPRVNAETMKLMWTRQGLDRILVLHSHQTHTATLLFSPSSLHSWVQQSQPPVKTHPRLDSLHLRVINLKEWEVLCAVREQQQGGWSLLRDVQCLWITMYVRNTFSLCSRTNTKTLTSHLLCFSPFSLRIPFPFYFTCACKSHSKIQLKRSFRYI